MMEGEDEVEHTSVMRGSQAAGVAGAGEDGREEVRAKGEEGGGDDTQSVSEIASGVASGDGDDVSTVVEGKSGGVTGGKDDDEIENVAMKLKKVCVFWGGDDCVGFAVVFRSSH